MRRSGSPPRPARKEARAPPYEKARRALRALMEREAAPSDTLDAVVGHLRDAFPHYSWVGIYLLEGDTLHLASWRGDQATEHTEIPVGVGICGLAARTKETVVVPDVSKDPRYLACFLSTKSEIVVPVLARGRVLGEIDIDSEKPDAFGPEDRRFLEGVAEDLARHLSRDPGRAFR